MTDYAEVAVGARIECADCGQALMRQRKTDRHRYEDNPLIDFVEVATGDHHKCWEQLPEDAEHLRLD